MAEKKNAGRTRANGEGSYRVRGKSIEFRWGEKKEKKTLTEPRNGRTEKELRERLAELRNMPKAFNPRITLADIAQEWYNDLDNQVKDGKLEESTYEGYKYTLAIIKREFAEDVFVDTSAKRLADGIANLRKTVRRKSHDTGEFIETVEAYDVGTLKKVRTMLGQVFAYGVLTERIRPADNPMAYVPEIKATERKKAVKKAYSEAEVVQLIKCLPQTRIGYAARLCIACSFRGQELVALRAADIAEDGSSITVDKAVKRGHKGKYYDGNTKTAAGDRVTEVPAFAWEWAKWLRENAVCGYILPNRSGGHLTVEVWRKQYYKAVDETGIEPLSPHKLRHTATTNMRTRAGIQGKVVMAINGQSDEATMEGYNHVDQDAKRKAASRYDRYIRRLMDGKESRKPTSFKLLSLGQRLGKNGEESSKQAN